MTRTQNSFFNFITSTFSTLLVVLLSFITRTVFVRYLSESYLGIDGYFSSILSMLSLTELGFGSAIIYKLYKPIEEGNRRRIQVLMKLYRNVYRIVGFVIVGLGLCLIPFLPRLIRDYDHLLSLGISPVLLFLLYLFNSAASYWFFAYKSALVSASQKSYILTAAGYTITIVGALVQILTLVITRNFLIYTIVLILQALSRNLLYAHICDKRNPYLKEKIDDRVSKEELKGFFKDCAALLLYRVSNAVIDGTDNIILGAFVGMTAVGRYTSIYGAIKTNFRSLLYNFLAAIQASIGSIYSTGNLEWSRLVFRVVNFCTVWLYGIAAVGFAVLMDEFIILWVGERFVVTSWTAAGGVTVATPLALLIGIQTYLSGQSFYCGSFRSAMGLFRELKYRPVASMIVNLAASLYLVPRIGIAGCVVSTIISESLTNLIIDPIIIHKHALKESPRNYFLRNFLYRLVTLAAGLLSWWLCRLTPVPGVPGFIVHGMLCVAVTSGAFTLCFFRTREFRFLVKTALSLLPGHSQSASPGEEGE